MLLMDFWGENPFAELELSFPPVPSDSEIRRKINEKKKILNSQMRLIKDKKGKEAEKEHEQLKAENKVVQDLQRQIFTKAEELRETLPYDKLLAVQPIAPAVFAQRSARATIIAHAWRAIWDGEDLMLSDTRRTDFQKDFTYNELLGDKKE